MILAGAPRSISIHCGTPAPAPQPVDVFPSTAIVAGLCKLFEALVDWFNAKFLMVERPAPGAGFVVAVGAGVSVGGIAVVGLAVGDGGGVLVGEGTAAVKVSLTACSMAAVTPGSEVEVGAARIEVASAVAVTSAG